jgi:hypothetical protein
MPSTNMKFCDLAIAYDENGNITRTEDIIYAGGAAGTRNGLFDVAYMMDAVNRMTRALEGHWNGSTIAVAKRKGN